MEPANKPAKKEVQPPLFDLKVETDLQNFLQTDAQRKTVREMIKDGKATSVEEAKEIMRSEDRENPTNDAWVSRK